MRAFKTITEMTIQNDLYLLSDDYVSSVSVFSSSGSVSAFTFGPVCSVSASTEGETDNSGVFSPVKGSFWKQVGVEGRDGEGLQEGSSAVRDAGSKMFS